MPQWCRILSDRDCASVEAGDIWEMSVSSPRFGYESKSVLKIDFIKSRVSNYIRFPLI